MEMVRKEETPPDGHSAEVDNRKDVITAYKHATIGNDCILKSQNRFP